MILISIPSTILDLNDLIESVGLALDILQSNQIAVSAKQPRQLIPFRLSDFSAAAENGSANFDVGTEDDQT